VTVLAGRPHRPRPLKAGRPHTFRSFICTSLDQWFAKARTQVER
jgi:hypothetical protein